MPPTEYRSIKVREDFYQWVKNKAWYARRSLVDHLEAIAGYVRKSSTTATRGQRDRSK